MLPKHQRILFKHVFLHAHTHHSKTLAAAAAACVTLALVAGVRLHMHTNLKTNKAFHHLKTLHAVVILPDGNSTTSSHKGRVRI